MTYLDLFRAATGGKTPYLWQCRLACGEAPEGANCDLEHPNEATLHWLSQGTPSTSHLIDIPTGLGKTAGVVMAWIWNRYRESEISNLKFETGSSSTPWPRRLHKAIQRNIDSFPENTIFQPNAWEKAEFISKCNHRDRDGPGASFESKVSKTQTPNRKHEYRE